MGATISGALTQTYPHIEVILCIDGATDESAAVAAAYGERITVIHQENQGVSAARNAAIEAATGELITQCDSDDMHLPQGDVARIGRLSYRLE